MIISFTKTLLYRNSTPRQAPRLWQIPKHLRDKYIVDTKMIVSGSVKLGNEIHEFGRTNIINGGGFLLPLHIVEKIIEHEKIINDKERIVFTLSLQDCIGDEAKAQFDLELKNAALLTESELYARLAEYPAIPKKRIVSVSVFDRSPYVVFIALRQAGGSCQRCLARAPFLKASDGSPYLEVHHIVTLASGGEDTVENAIALCPNCHREAHYG